MTVNFPHAHQVHPRLRTGCDWRALSMHWGARLRPFLTWASACGRRLAKDTSVDPHTHTRSPCLQRVGFPAEGLVSSDARPSVHVPAIVEEPLIHRDRSRSWLPPIAVCKVVRLGWTRGAGMLVGPCGLHVYVWRFLALHESVVERVAEEWSSRGLFKRSS